MGGQLHVDLDRKKLDPIDVVLSSSHAKKLAFLYQKNYFGCISYVKNLIDKCK